MSRPLYMEDVDDPAKLTDTQLDQLRVKNTADEFSLTRHIHLLAKHLKLTAIETRDEVTIIRHSFLVDKNQVRPIATDFKTYLLFILRWRCRGLSVLQSIRKIVLDAIRRGTWTTRQNKYWKK